jgi:molecular chaperone HtpG
LQYALKVYKCLVEVKRFQPDTIPALFYMDKDQVAGKDIENIKEDSDDFWSSITESVFKPQEFDSKLYLNLQNQIVLKLLNGTAPDTEKLILEMLYINAMMMGHYPISNKELNMLNHNTIALINKL